MGERLQKLPKWARTVLVIASIVAPVSGASVTGFKACMEIRSAKKAAVDAEDKAVETTKQAEAGYDTISPAIEELQSVLNSAQEWAAVTDQDLDEYGDRLERCEDYMMKLSRRRGFPKMPELEEEYDEGPWYENPVAASVLPALPTGERPPRPAKPVAKALRPIPKSLGKAADYQQQRIKEHCAPDDPLCGADAIKKPKRPPHNPNEMVPDL